MPTFDFQCSACSTTFEFSRPFGSKKKPSCPSCGSRKVEKHLTPPAIQFKGKGFYKTDSVKVSKKKPVKDSSSDKKTETTTAPSSPPSPTLPPPGEGSKS
jgi:putative FmdB family regulatory protein